jgi:hypothetical protein
MLLDSGRLAFVGNLQEFQTCDLPSVGRMLELDQPDHAGHPYFEDPWDRSRQPQEKLL